MEPDEWRRHVHAWSHPPVDHLNQYISADKLMQLPDDALCALVHEMSVERFGGWRNHHNLWRDVLGLDLGDRRIIDFGCGVGLEASELVRVGNTVDVADISTSNLTLAARVIQTCVSPNRAPLQLVVGPEWPFITELVGGYDTFHCSGVLHHIPWARLIMERAHQLLTPNGDVRLMLYSDRGWREATETEPPEDDQLTGHPRFVNFVRYFDQVGDYATWYDAAKLRRLFGDLFTIERVEYMGPTERYLGAVMRRREMG